VGLNRTPLRNRRKDEKNSFPTLAHLKCSMGCIPVLKKVWQKSDAYQKIIKTNNKIIKVIIHKVPNMLV
jgi:hypothetical protein